MGHLIITVYVTTPPGWIEEDPKRAELVLDKVTGKLIDSASEAVGDFHVYARDSLSTDDSYRV